MRDLTGDQRISWRAIEEFYGFLSVEPHELCGHQEANEGLGEFQQDYLNQTLIFFINKNLSLIILRLLCV